MDEQKRKALEVLLKRNVLVSPELLENIDKLGIEEIKKTGNELSSVEILQSYYEPPRKRECSDFVEYYNDRFRAIERMLAARPEMSGATSISRLKFGRQEKATIIGMIADKQTTKNEHIMLTVEDQTGSAKVLVSKAKQELYNTAKDCVMDEIIGITGAYNGELLFAGSIIHPDVPAEDAKKSPYEGYAVFLSDIHVGSKKFLGEEFSKFLSWINSELGSEQQKELARKVKYVFIIGDIVDGVGIYPDQDEELEEKDIFGQYKKCAELLSRIPKDKKIIISPGNHDSMRISEPQPPFIGEMFVPLLNLPNVYPVSNPAYVTLDKTPDFPGLTVLVYHGYSFDYYVANVESIRTKGGYDRADLIMKFLLQRRHLSPTHSATLYIPSATDNLVIRKVPDIFATGHIHRSYASQYKHVTLISSSCWQGKTSFQERMGHVPQPARVPIVNLQTREVKILKFGAEE